MMGREDRKWVYFGVGVRLHAPNLNDTHRKPHCAPDDEGK